jgi:ABC-type antimicrobial peptide transport system permease subunit
MKKNLRQHPGLSLFTTVVILTLWRWRQHWFLLLITGLGMLTSVIIVCTVPLLSETMTTAGLRSVLRAFPDSSEITLTTSAAGLSSQGSEQVYQVVNQPVQQNLATYFSGSPQFEIESPFFKILSPTPPDSSDQMSILGTSTSTAAPHVTIMQGRLPQPTSGVVEVAVTPETAGFLRLHIGSVILPKWTFYTAPDFPTPIYQPFPLHVVGIFAVKSGDAFWHGYNFLPQSLDKSLSTNYTVLASAQNMLAAFDHIALNQHIPQVFFFQPARLTWYYRLNTPSISIGQLDDLIQQLGTTQAYIAANFNDPTRVNSPPHIRGATLSSPVLSLPGLPGTLERFRGQLAAARIPVALLAAQILFLVLLFVGMMAALLVDRQADTIILLRSRGSSRSQIIGALLTQSIGLSLFALALGPPLAIAMAYLVTQRLLPPAGQDAVNVIAAVPMQALIRVLWYAIAAAVVTIATMMFSLYRASKADVWVINPQAARSARRPLWHRLHLDIVAIIFALTGYGISVYLSGIAQLLDEQTRALVLSPLSLLAPIFLLLAAVLLFLRIFPLLLQLGSILAMRNRGAAPMLALAQMARAPRQSLRMILLLALTTAFAIFTLVFAASQTQRAQDIATYQAGADFSGQIPSNTINPTLEGELALYRHIPGVIAVTAGYVEDETSSVNAAALPVQLRAVDPNTFAQATFWPLQDPSASPTSLMVMLTAHRSAAIQSRIIPAIINASIASTFGLHVGAPFSLYNASNAGVTLRYVVIAEVPHLPGLSPTSAGNMLVDYQSFAAVQLKQSNTNIPVNHIWLHTSSDVAALASVRKALNKPALHLDDLYDQRLLAGSLRGDPLSLNLVGLLTIGTSTALLLAFVGSLLASWLSVRRRLTSFILLQALGATRKQVANVLTWEQGIIYITALFLGLIFGVLLAATAVPTLVFSVLPITAAVGNVSNNQWYTLQQAIPFQVVIPPSLALAGVAFVVICIAALAVMTLAAVRPSISQTLRLDENQASEYLVREDALIASSRVRQIVPQHRRRFASPYIVTLAFWQLRQAWLFWLIQGVSIIAAVTIVCTVPLLSTVTNTAELHNVLNATPETSEITLGAFTQGLSSHVFDSVKHQTTSIFQQHIGSYLSQPTPLSIQSTGFTLLSPGLSNSRGALRLIGTSFEQAAPHLRLLQGRLPLSSSNGDIETLLTSMTAQNLHATLGSILTLRGDFFTNPRDMFGGASPSGVLHVHVVGLFNVTPANVPFWHGEDFTPSSTGQGLSYPLLVSNEALLTSLDHIAAASNIPNAATVFSPQTFELLWYYHLDTSHITVDQVDHLINGLTSLQASVANTFGNVQNSETQPDGSLGYPYLLHVDLFNPSLAAFDLPTVLDQYRNHTAVASIPITILTAQIFALLLLLVSLVALLLVDRQADAIALLRSRGASSNQVFGFLLIQGLLPGIMALMLGPLLAVLVVSFITQSTLALPTFFPGTGPFLQAALSVSAYAIGTVILIMLVLIFLLYQAARLNALTFRREAARSTRRPLWHSLNLDVIAALIAFAGFVISLYLGSIGKLFDVRTQALVAAPLGLVAPIFLLIGILLLFLRFFSPLLGLGERRASSRRGVVSMLALAQMARSPREALRMTLLLSLAIAFAIFTLVFYASQSQHILDIAAYESGADFSGDLPVTAQHLVVKSETALYHHISGVTAATVGFTATGSSSGTSPAIPIQLRGVDAVTFAQTAIWTPQDSSQSLTSLMAQLLAARHDGIAHDVVPAIVDAATMNRLGLHIGATLSINLDNLPNNSLSCNIIAEVQHIPTVNASDETGNAGNYAPPGGVLVDYTTYAAVYKLDAIKSGSTADPYLPINHVWLRTQSDPAIVTTIRATLQTPALRLTNLYDRRLLIATMLNDPLYLSLMSILVIGAATALMLALLGNLLASWHSIRARLTSFVVLRSLGATVGQATRVLLWEQGIVYASALFLGVIFGIVLSATAVPTLTFTSTPASGVLSSTSNDDFYIIQHIIPTPIVTPPSLWLVFIVLVAIFVLVLTTMAGVLLRPSLGQTLRLNED